MMNLGNIFDPVKTEFDNPPNFAPPSFNVPAGAPAPAMGAVGFNPGPSAKSVTGWDNFLGKLATDKNLQMSMLQAGMQMMTPKGAGENYASKIGQGLAIGQKSYQEGEQNDRRNAWMEAQTEGTRANTEGQQSQNRVNVATEDEQIQGKEEALKQAKSDTHVKGVEAYYADTFAKSELANDKASRASSYASANSANASAERTSVETGLLRKYGDEQAIADLESVRAETEARKRGQASDMPASQQIALSATEAAFGPRMPNNASQWDKAYLNNLNLTTLVSKSPDELSFINDAIEKSGVNKWGDSPKRDSALAAVEQDAKRIWAEHSKKNRFATPPPGYQPPTTNGAPLRSAGNPSPQADLGQTPPGQPQQQQPPQDTGPVLTPQEQMYFDKAVKRYVQSGMSPEAARQKALSWYQQTKKQQGAM